MQIWKSRDRTLLKKNSPALLMGILNVTPDSFSDGGDYYEPDAAVDRALTMVAEGAQIIDIGGESTRPGATPVSAQEEIKRILPVLERLRSQTDAWISIDTSKPEVALAAIDAGADIINDVTGLRGDSNMASIIAASNIALVIMHMQGTPATMQEQPQYGNFTNEINQFFSQQLAYAQKAGIALENIALDPGIGFGKKCEHNLAIFRHLPQWKMHRRPLLLGFSRKSFIGEILHSVDLEARHWPTVALTAWARQQGAAILRVHDVASCAQALRMTEKFLLAGAPPTML